MGFFCIDVNSLRNPIAERPHRRTVTDPSNNNDGEALSVLHSRIRVLRYSCRSLCLNCAGSNKSDVSGACVELHSRPPMHLTSRRCAMRRGMARNMPDTALDDEGFARVCHSWFMQSMSKSDSTPYQSIVQLVE
jgi:hypothetical protein